MTLKKDRKIQTTIGLKWMQSILSDEFDLFMSDIHCSILIPLKDFVKDSHRRYYDIVEICGYEWAALILLVI